MGVENLGSPLGGPRKDDAILCHAIGDAILESPERSEVLVSGLLGDLWSGGLVPVEGVSVIRSRRDFSSESVMGWEFTVTKSRGRYPLVQLVWSSGREKDSTQSGIYQ